MWLRVGWSRGVSLSSRSSPALAETSPEQLAAVALSPGGGALHWEALDADLSVPGLLLDAIGRSEAFRERARMAGRVRNRAMAAAEGDASVGDRSAGEAGWSPTSGPRG